MTNPCFHSFLLHNLPINLQLGPEAVHLWQVHLDLPPHRVQPLMDLLCLEERSRAERFLQPQHRQRFIVGRGILRLLLASYLDVRPTELKFVYGSHGKPAVTISGDRPAIAFNLSHSHDLGLYAISTNRAIGVDLEQLRPIANVEQLADRFFSNQEAAFLATLPPERRSSAFLHLWTGKEAYLKATGEGLAGLKQVEVVLTPTLDSIALKLQEPSQYDQDWTVKQFHPQPDYIATLAVVGRIAELKCYTILDLEP